MKNKIKKLLKGFKKIWKEKEDKDELTNIIIEKLLKDDKAIGEEEYEAYVDYASVMAIIPKKTSLIKLIKNNFEVGEIRNKDNFKKLLNPYIPSSSEEQASNYNPELLTIIFNLIKIYDTPIKIKILKDFPLWVECEDFICILAQREQVEENG